MTKKNAHEGSTKVQNNIIHGKDSTTTLLPIYGCGGGNCIGVSYVSDNPRGGIDNIRLSKVNDGRVMNGIEVTQAEFEAFVKSAKDGLYDNHLN